jgi:hypothetical protein
MTSTHFWPFLNCLHFYEIDAGSQWRAPRCTRHTRSAVHRAEHQKRLRAANPDWEGFGAGVVGSSRPDGDTELSKEVIQKVCVLGGGHVGTETPWAQMRGYAPFARQSSGV